jgi:hypothetical protein
MSSTNHLTNHRIAYIQIVSEIYKSILDERPKEESGKPPVLCFDVFHDGKELPDKI